MRTQAEKELYLFENHFVTQKTLAKVINMNRFTKLKSSGIIINSINIWVIYLYLGT